MMDIPTRFVMEIKTRKQLGPELRRLLRLSLMLLWDLETTPKAWVENFLQKHDLSASAQREMREIAQEVEDAGPGYDPDLW